MDTATQNVFDFIERFSLDESKTRESLSFWRKGTSNLSSDLATLKNKAKSYSALALVFAGMRLNSFALPIADDVDRFYDLYWPYANIKAEFDGIMDDIATIQNF
jgi:hypothetical protein